MTIRELLFGVVAPALLATLGLLATRAVRSQLGTWALRAGWDGALLALGLIAAHLALIGSPTFDPRGMGGLDLLPLAAGLLALGALLAADGPDARWWRWPVLVVLLAVVIAAPLLRLELLARAERLDSGVAAQVPRFLAIALGLGAAATLLLAGNEAVARRAPPLAWALCWIVVAAVAAGACLLHGTASLGMDLGAVAAGLGGLALAAFGLGEVRWSGLTLAMIGLLAAVGMLVAAQRDDLRFALAFAALLATPLLAGLGPWCARTPFLQGLIALAAVAGAAAAVLWWQWPEPVAGYP